jgi:hypothetical protein
MKWDDIITLVNCDKWAQNFRQMILNENDLLKDIVIDGWLTDLK